MFEPRTKTFRSRVRHSNPMIYVLNYETGAYCLALLCSAESKCILIRQQVGHNTIMHLKIVSSFQSIAR